MIFTRKRVFHPIIILSVSFIAALIFAVLIIIFFKGQQRFWLLFYCVPIGIPFVGFLFDRASQWRKLYLECWIIDIIVISLALMRAGFLDIPFISGHALFLSYTILTTKIRIVKFLAICVMIQVIYLKIFVWNDITILGGIVLGCLAGFGFNFILKKQKK